MPWATDPVMWGPVSPALVTLAPTPDDAANAHASRTGMIAARPRCIRSGVTSRYTGQWTR